MVSRRAGWWSTLWRTRTLGGTCYAPAGLLIPLGRGCRIVKRLAWGLFAAWAAWTLYLVRVFQTWQPK